MDTRPLLIREVGSDDKKQTLREISYGVGQGLGEVAHADPQIREFISLLFRREVELASDTHETPATFSERFEGQVTGGDVVAMIQEATYRILPYLPEANKTPDAAQLDLLLDDSTVNIAFEDITDTIGEPRWLRIETHQNGRLQVSGLLFPRVEYMDPLNQESNYHVQVTGMRLFYPGSFTSVQAFETAANEGLATSDNRSRPSDVNLVIKQHTLEGQEIATILHYLDRLVAAYVPTE